MKSGRGRSIMSYFIAMYVFAAFLGGCGSGGGGSTPPTYKASGQFQKGPFAIGSQVIVSELDETLNSTGKNYYTQTKDDLGYFDIGSRIGTHLVEITGDGFYMDELTGQLASSRIQLRAIVDLSENLNPTINVLTSLQSLRIKKLVSQGSSYSSAEAQSRNEVLAAFGIDHNKVSSLAALSSMKIDGGTDADSVLLATSAIIARMAKDAAAANSTSETAELANYINRMTAQIANTGTVTNDIVAARKIAATEIDLPAVRTNTETYYAARNVGLTAPKFEEWVDKDSSDVLPRRLMEATAISFTDDSGVEPQHEITSNAVTLSGLGDGIAVPVTVDDKTTIIKNGVATKGTVTTAHDNDTISLRVTSLGYGQTSTSSITVGVTSATWRVTTRPLGGTVRMLVGTGLLLQNGNDTVTIPAGSTSFSFNSTLTTGSRYDIKVLAQPTDPPQVCTVANGAGTVGSGAANITVSCAGPVSGLAFSDVTGVNPQQSITSNAVTISGLGSDVAATVTVDDGTTIIKNGSGLAGGTTTVQDGDTIALRVASAGYGLTRTSSVTIGPSSASWKVVTKPLGGSITGLTGSGLVLQNSGGEKITIPPGSTSFSFSSPVANGAAFHVTVLAHPTSPLQACTVSNGSGTAGAGSNNLSIACSNAGLAYVARTTFDNNISAFLVNKATGSLTSIGTFTTFQNPSAIAVTPSGKFLYTASIGQAVSGYRIGEGGQLSHIESISAANEPNSLGIAIHPSSNFAYVVKGGSENVVTTYSVNPTTGVLSRIGSVACVANPLWASITVDPSGTYAYVPNDVLQNVSVYRISANGTLASAGTFAGISTRAPLRFDPSGRFAYLASNTSNSIFVYSVDPATGALANTGTFPTGAIPKSIAIDGTGKYAYVAVANFSIESYGIDQATGALTNIGTVQTGTAPTTTATDGQFLFAAGPAGVIDEYAIDTTTGALTSIGTTTSRESYGLSGLVFTSGAL